MTMAGFICVRAGTNFRMLGIEKVVGLKGCDSVNPDHVQILVEYLPKYLVSYLSGVIKG